MKELEDKIEENLQKEQKDKETQNWGKKIRQLED